MPTALASTVTLANCLLTVVAGRDQAGGQGGGRRRKGARAAGQGGAAAGGAGGAGGRAAAGHPRRLGRPAQRAVPHRRAQ